ncbi:damage-control phosphatase ARMT1 family protein [Hydrogenimonas sp.]
MRLEPECITCIFSQALRVCETLHVDKERTKNVLDEVARMIPGFSYAETPPQVAARVYPKIAEVLGVEDIYRDFKREATERAARFIPAVERKIEESGDTLHAALKAAVAGNVIDLAATHSFDLDEEVAKVFETPFAIDDTEALRERLATAERLLLVGDNVGEHLFDRVLLQRLRRLYPDLIMGYAVRGRPIINDVTRRDAEEAGIAEVAEIVDSGVDTPGFDFGRLSREARQWYERADLVIAKGMGNYESMNDASRKPTYYLMKVKCHVVASSLGRQIGDILCYEGAADV